MNFKCQQECVADLQSFAKSKKHSVLIVGDEGTGKTHLARYYGQLLDISDFQIIPPTVQSVRYTIEECYRIDNNIVICIENIDTGVAGVAYALLKFLEEPDEHVYIVATCRNINKIPDTIISRSVTANLTMPFPEDIASFANQQDSGLYIGLKDMPIWKSIRSFSDVNQIFNMKLENIQYIEQLASCLTFKQPIADIVWALGHYPDNSEIPAKLVMQYLVTVSPTRYIQKAAIHAISALNQHRIAAHIILTKFVMECKYCE